jgi:hypothetical protein
VPLDAFVVVVTLLLLYAIYRNSRHLRKGRPLDGLTNGIMRAASRLRGPRPSNAGASE